MSGKNCDIWYTEILRLIYIQFVLLCNVSHDQASPFCTGQPVFTLAEPGDVIIICGEFNSGVEILKESWEPEQVFTVTKIIQHPNYKPTTVRQHKPLLLRHCSNKDTNLSYSKSNPSPTHLEAIRKICTLAAASFWNFAFSRQLLTLITLARS